MIIFFVKLIICVIGLVAAFVFLVIGLIKRGQDFRMAWSILFLTALTLGLITLTEFVFHDSSEKYSDKPTLLVAMREASLGGIHLRVYSDSTYELGDGIKVARRGKIALNGDTLFLLKSDSISKSFLIQSEVLHEIKNTGIKFLEIESNTLLKIH
jgi:hypothetical protein